MNAQDAMGNMEGVKPAPVCALHMKISLSISKVRNVTKVKQTNKNLQQTELSGLCLLRIRNVKLTDKEKTINKTPKCSHTSDSHLNIFQLAISHNRKIFIYK